MIYVNWFLPCPCLFFFVELLQYAYMNWLLPCLYVFVEWLQYADCEKRNILVVDLYKENSDLMEALYLMEERKKDAVSRCYKLEDQCKVLRVMLKKVCHVAIT